MKKLLKKILIHSPVIAKKTLLHSRELFYAKKSEQEEKSLYPNLPKLIRKKHAVKNILIYHISGMFYAGTEKNLQLIANELVGDYNITYMYSRDNFSQQQKDLMDPRITCIEFSYTSIQKDFPHVIQGMTPHIKEVANSQEIDLIITSLSGHSQYPFTTIREIPIIVINIFGSPSVQKNIISTVFISKTVLEHSEQYTGKKKSNTWAHLAVTGPTRTLHKEQSSIRVRFEIPSTSFVFGRVGRGADSIYDPIGIEAFKLVVQKYPSIHYIIMSPPPILIKKVEMEKIPNVHFMTDKENIWDFNEAIDCLAHFRFDGETFGLNIAESMLAGNPIISHTSHIWNAHLEYLTQKFSRIAQKDNVKEYANHMEGFIEIHNKNHALWKLMQEEARMVATNNFNRKKYGETIKNIIQNYS